VHEHRLPLVIPQELQVTASAEIAFHKEGLLA
jgi:hypothetical protein